jgi:hypothetical protein
MKPYRITQSIALYALFCPALLLAQWIPTDNFPGGGNYIQCFVVHKDGLFAGTSFNGVYKAASGADAWDVILPDEGVWSLASDGEMLYAGTQSSGLYISGDDGDGWEKYKEAIPIVSELAVFNDMLFVGSRIDGCFLSQDAGQTLRSVNKGLESTVILDFTERKGNLLASTRNGVFCFDEEDESWAQFGNGLADSSIWCLTVSDSITYAGAGKNIYQCNGSDDDWEPIYSINGDLSDLVCHEGWLYAASNKGVHFCEIGDEEIVQYNEGLGDTDIISLGIYDGYLFAGTYRNSAWKHQMPQPVAAKIFSKDAPAGFDFRTRLLNGIVHVSFPNAHAGNVTICRLNGATVFNTRLPAAGSFSVSVPRLNAGVYIVNVREGTGNVVRKMRVQ